MTGRTAVTKQHKLAELTLRYGWDEQLTGLLGALSEAEIDAFTQSFSSWDKDGWLYTLPKLHSDSTVLCLESRFGVTAAALAEIAGEVTVIHPCRITVQIIVRGLADQGIHNVRVVHVSPDQDRLPFPDGTFDAVIHHDIASTLGRNLQASIWPFTIPGLKFAVEAYRILKSHGFLHCGVRNRWGYSKWKHLPVCRDGMTTIPESRPPSLSCVRQGLLEAQFATVILRPYLVNHGRVSEVLSRGGYRSVQNPLRLSEHAKEILLGKVGARHLAPAFGLLATKQLGGESPVSLIRKSLTDEGLLPERSRECGEFLRYVVLPGKVVITLGDSPQGSGNIVVVIPRVPSSSSGRKRELAVIEELRTLGPAVSSYLPKVYRELPVDGRLIYAMSEIQGVTFDLPMAIVDDLSRRALDFILSFNRLTAHEQLMDESGYATTFTPIFDRARTTYPDLAPLLSEINAIIKRSVINTSLVTCWLHGDFKLENLMFDRKTLRIIGVIDWEHARKNGLPWLDVLYLITYNRITNGEGNFFSVFRNVIAMQAFSEPETGLLQRQAEGLRLRSSLWAPSVALFFIHHIAFRIHYNMDAAEDRDNLTAGLQLVLNQLANPLPQRFGR